MSSGPGEIRIAVSNDPHLLDYALWRPGAPDGVGDVLRGRIDAVVPALGGAFVDIGACIGFLPLSGGSSSLPEGKEVVVRVVRAAQGNKGPRLIIEQDQNDVRTSKAVGLIRAAPSPLVRLSKQYPSADIMIDDPALRAEAPAELRTRMTIIRETFPPDVEDQVSALADPIVSLPAGMRASIHPTPALVAIDLDTAANSSGRLPKALAQFAANRSVLPVLLHQLRLRNLSGAIMLDFAGLASRKRPALRGDIETALSFDPVGPRLLGFTALGLAEILRPRVHPPLHELLSGSHASALAALKAASVALDGVSVAGGRAPTLHAALDVMMAIKADGAALDWFRSRHGRLPALHADPNLGTCAWRLRHD